MGTEATLNTPSQQHGKLQVSISRRNIIVGLLLGHWKQEEQLLSGLWGQLSIMFRKSQKYGSILHQPKEKKGSQRSTSKLRCWRARHHYEFSCWCCDPQRWKYPGTPRIIQSMHVQYLFTECIINIWCSMLVLKGPLFVYELLSSQWSYEIFFNPQ